VIVTESSETTIDFDVDSIPAPVLTAEPAGFVVQADDGTRIHFLDWRPKDDLGPGAGYAPVLLIHGLAQTAWIWTPVARRLSAATHTAAMDLRGHGLSDSPTDGYDPEVLAEDAIAVAEGSGLLAPGGQTFDGRMDLDDTDGRVDLEGVGLNGRVVLAGHGFGAILAAWTAARLGHRCAGLLLVDGGWEDIGATAGMDPDELLRGLDEPPEVLRSMEAFLADRRDFDPATWDADQERAARFTVVEAHSKRLTPAARPHALAACVEAMFAYNPAVVLPSVEAPIVALIAGRDADATRLRALGEMQRVMVAAARPPIRVAAFSGVGHNLMRYRPREVTAAVLGLASTIGS
jgi:pimeloyl-ACP methyl ester carboxylesterase